MAGLWLNMDTVAGGMVRLIVPRARNLSSIIHTLEGDGDWLNAQIKELGLERPSAQKGHWVAEPPAELPAFLRRAGVEEAVLAAGVLGRSAGRLKRQAQALGFPKLTFQRKGTMRPAPPEWAALHPLLWPAALNFSEPICFRTTTENRARPEAEPEITTRWILPAPGQPETELSGHRRRN